MGWDARLIDDRGHYEGDWNYTHNTSAMIYAVCKELGIELKADGAVGRIAWWQHLDGMSGKDGAAFLDAIIRGLLADPDRFMAMNPANGWGSYDGLLQQLIRMRDAVPEWPTVWHAGG